MSEAREVLLPKHGAVGNGFLSFVQKGSLLPFSPKRAFWIYQWYAGYGRGDHAHREQHQFFICLFGGVRVILDSPSNEYHLSDPRIGLYVPPLRWIELLATSTPTVLLCLASGEYDEKDYIRDWAEFEKLTGGAQ